MAAEVPETAICCNMHRIPSISSLLYTPEIVRKYSVSFSIQNTWHFSRPLVRTMAGPICVAQGSTIQCTVELCGVQVPKIADCHRSNSSTLQRSCSCRYTGMKGMLLLHNAGPMCRSAIVLVEEASWYLEVYRLRSAVPADQPIGRVYSKLTPPHHFQYQLLPAWHVHPLQSPLSTPSFVALKSAALGIYQLCQMSIH